MSGLGVPVLIRAYGRSDLRETAGVMYRSATKAYQNINWHAEEAEVLQAFSDLQDSRWTEIWVGVNGKEVVGVMCLEGVHVDQLFIDPKWQGQGIGRLLLEQAKVACPSGFTLDVFKANEPARAFYDHLGFVFVDEFDSKREGEREIRLRWTP